MTIELSIEELGKLVDKNAGANIPEDIVEPEDDYIPKAETLEELVDYKPDTNGSEHPNAPDGVIEQEMRHAKQGVDAPLKSFDATDWRDKYVVTPEEAETFDDPDWFEPNYAPKGQFTVIIAPPAGGKTTTALEVAKRGAANGFDVIYVLADIGQSGAKEIVRFANEHEFTLLLPDLKEGFSMNSVVDDLVRLTQSGNSLVNTVLIFDTLKKMTDVIIKNKAKDLYKILRKLTAIGATVIVLGHSNKYLDNEGNLIYEGTSDLLSDCDNLIYLLNEKQADDSLTISTKPSSKVRAKYEPITLHINPERVVTWCAEFIDVERLNQSKERFERDREIIEAINEALAVSNDPVLQKDIIKACKASHGIGHNRVFRTLKHYSVIVKPEDRLWHVNHRFDHNGKEYSTPIEAIKVKTHKTHKTIKPIKGSE